VSRAPPNHRDSYMTERIKGFALITGASAGIGAVYADRLARRGYDLILVARRADRLQAIAERITAKTGRKVEISSPISATAPTSGDAMGDVIALNIHALVRLTYAVAPRFVERGGGSITNMSSAVAIRPEMLNGVYGASKAFVLAFSQSLKHELADKGVRIQVVLPGVVATESWANNGMPVDTLPKEVVMSTDDLVDAALAGFDLGEAVTIPSLPNQAQWDRYETARHALAEKISNAIPAARYNMQQRERQR
jgi:uncharacterized protein